MLRWLAAFGLTQAVEIPVMWRAQADRPASRRLLVAAGASALTHPVVWFVAPLLITPWTTMVWAAETFAVLTEALWLRAFGVQRALWWSLLANSLSLAVGLAVRAFVGWP